MEFELQWLLSEFREEQLSLFDEDGKRYSGVRMGDNAAEMMLKLINGLVEELATNDNTAELYNELIMQVGNKYEGESRHETALRYIKGAEMSDNEAHGGNTTKDQS